VLGLQAAFFIGVLVWAMLRGSWLTQGMPQGMSQWMSQWTPAVLQLALSVAADFPLLSVLIFGPLAAAVVALVFWERPPLMVAALMPLTWGDGLAPVVGAAYGRRFYTIHTSIRTLEGSAGFFVAGFVFTWLALWLMPGLPEITPLAAVLPSLVIMSVTTVIEAVSIWGLDNLTITAAAVVILNWWPF